MKPSASIVIPDSHELSTGYRCDAQAQECVVDETAVTIHLGYLRELLELIDACRKQRI